MKRFSCNYSLHNAVRSIGQCPQFLGPLNQMVSLRNLNHYFHSPLLKVRWKFAQRLKRIWPQTIRCTDFCKVRLVREKQSWHFVQRSPWLILAVKQRCLHRLRYLRNNTLKQLQNYLDHLQKLELLGEMERARRLYFSPAL